MQEIDPDKQFEARDVVEPADKETQMAILVTLMRCYDMLTVIALSANESMTRVVIEGHEAGRVINSAPQLDMRNVQ